MYFYTRKNNFFFYLYKKNCLFFERKTRVKRTRASALRLLRRESRRRVGGLSTAKRRDHTSWCRRKLGSRAAAVRACAANVYELRRPWWRGARALRGNMCQQLSPVVDLSTVAAAARVYASL